MGSRWSSWWRSWQISDYGAYGKFIGPQFAQLHCGAEGLGHLLWGRVECIPAGQTTARWQRSVRESPGRISPVCDRLHPEAARRRRRALSRRSSTSVEGRLWLGGEPKTMVPGVQGYASGHWFARVEAGAGDVSSTSWRWVPTSLGHHPRRWHSICRRCISPTVVGWTPSSLTVWETSEGNRWMAEVLRKMGTSRSCQRRTLLQHGRVHGEHPGGQEGGKPSRRKSLRLGEEADGVRLGPIELGSSAGTLRIGLWSFSLPAIGSLGQTRGHWAGQQAGEEVQDQPADHRSQIGMRTGWDGGLVSQWRSFCRTTQGM